MDEEMIECIQCLYRYKTNRTVQKETLTGIEWVQAVRLVYENKKFLVRFDPEKYGVIITTPSGEKLHGDDNCVLVIYEFVEGCGHSFYGCEMNTEEWREAFEKIGTLKIPVILYTDNSKDIHLLYSLYNIGALECEDLGAHPSYNIVEYTAVYDKENKFTSLTKRTIADYM